jgi:bifunctional non-homologous end joining protein LigD
VQDDRGRSDFGALKSAIRREPHRLVFYGFDLLPYDRVDLRECPLVERRAKLEELVGSDAGPLQYSEEFSGDGAALFIACAKHGLEGIVSKEAASRYRSGRSKTWLKTKCFTESSFVIIGMDRDRKTGAMMALLARIEEYGLTYAGAAFIGLPTEVREGLQIRLAALNTTRPPFLELRSRTAQWAKPKLVVRVRHLAGAKGLCHAVVKAIS